MRARGQTDRENGREGGRWRGWQGFDGERDGWRESERERDT